MSTKVIKYYGLKEDKRAIKIVWNNEKIIFCCIVEINERGHSRGIPIMKIVGEDDKDVMQYIYAFRSFAPELSKSEYDIIAKDVSNAIMEFDTELALIEGLSQTNLITG